MTAALKTEYTFDEAINIIAGLSSRCYLFPEDYEREFTEEQIEGLKKALNIEVPSNFPEAPDYAMINIAYLREMRRRKHEKELISETNEETFWKKDNMMDLFVREEQNHRRHDNYNVYNSARNYKNYQRPD